MRTLRILVTLLSLRHKVRMMYPVAYVAFHIARLVGYVSEYLVIWLILMRFRSIGGWTLPEVLLLHSLNVISYTLAASFLWHVAANIERLVVSGELDGVLLKPISPLVWLCGYFYSPNYISQSILGLGVLFYAATSLGLSWSVATIGLLVLVLIGSTGLQAALFLFACDVCFWTVRGRSIVQTIVSFRNMISYPMSIYGTGVRFLLTFVVPVAFINYYPAGLFLNRPEYAEVRDLVVIAPVVGLGLFALAVALWRRGLAAYSSAGS